MTTSNTTAIDFDFAKNETKKLFNREEKVRGQANNFLAFTLWEMWREDRQPKGLDLSTAYALEKEEAQHRNNILLRELGFYWYDEEKEKYVANDDVSSAVVSNAKTQINRTLVIVANWIVVADTLPPAEREELVTISKTGNLTLKGLVAYDEETLSDSPKKGQNFVDIGPGKDMSFKELKKNSEQAIGYQRPTRKPGGSQDEKVSGISADNVLNVVEMLTLFIAGKSASDFQPKTQAAFAGLFDEIANTFGDVENSEAEQKTG